MATQNPSSERDLCEEIVAEAQRKAEQIIQSARQQTETLLARSREDAEKARLQRLNKARAKGGNQRERLLATIPIHKRRLRATKTENILQSIYKEVLERLNAGTDFDYSKTLIALATEAMNGMSSKAFILKLSPADHRNLGEKLVGEITNRKGNSAMMSIQLESDPRIMEGGLIIQDSEGHQIWDNRLSVRLERMWPELRRQLADGIPNFLKNYSDGGNS